MKVSKQVHGYKIRLSDGEMDLLREMVAMAENVPDVLWRRLGTQARRSYSRRCGPKGQGLPLLRVDKDWRGGE